jgi:hypothetical protein
VPRHQRGGTARAHPAGPKRGDLRRDGRYALHSETYPPPREDDGFAVTGRVAEIADRGTWEMVRIPPEVC